MKERPNIFSAPMVRAILEGRKTQTRRVIKPIGDGETPMHVVKHGGKLYLDETPHACPYGQPGDRLWVRETWAYHVQAIGSVTDEDGPFVYRADRMAEQSRLCDRWRPSIHMPRWASRILLEVVSVRVERLNEISEVDANAEGCRAIQGCEWHTFEEAAAGIPMHKHTAIDAYSALWESINGPGSWEANPWVWVVEFKRVQP